jgi:uncharacterized membrane protein
MAFLQRKAQAHRRTLLKTASYYLMHMAVAAVVAYLVTGDLLAAITLSLLEPTVQAVAYFFHERAWAAQDARSGAAEAAQPA